MRNANGKVALRRTDGDDDRFDGRFSYADIIRSLDEKQRICVLQSKGKNDFFALVLRRNIVLLVS